MKWAAFFTAAVASANYLKVEFDVLQQSSAAKRDEDAKDIPIKNEGYWYVAELDIGSDKQKVRVLLDTGSSDFFVVQQGAQCLTGANDCDTYGEFNPALSTSFKVNSSLPPFSYHYVDQTNVSGLYVQDRVQLADYVIDDCVIALANSTSSQFGVLGLGFAGKLKLINKDLEYPNFPQRLKDDGLVKKNLYSLYLNSISAESGAVLFGAIDWAKIDGNLTTLPIVNIYEDISEKPIEVSVELTDINVENGDQSIDISQNHYVAMLDSGLTATLLPVSLFKAFVLALGGWAQPNGEHYINCPSNGDATVLFNFNGAEIKVPLEEVVINLISYPGLCQIVGIRPIDDNMVYVGDSVLRHAYLVYDLDDYLISIGKVKFTNDTDIKVVEKDVPLEKTVSLVVTMSKLASYSEAPATAQLAYQTGSLTVERYTASGAGAHRALNDSAAGNATSSAKGSSAVATETLSNTELASELSKSKTSDGGANGLLMTPMVAVLAAVFAYLV